MREPGWYWVQNVAGRWEVARWCGKHWWLTGAPYNYFDLSFAAIDERPIVREVKSHD